MPVVTADQVISLHNTAGVMIYQFPAKDYSQLTWTRTQRDASTCTISVPATADSTDRLVDIAPWTHWITVWDGERNTVLWTGPIQKVTSSRTGGLRLAVKDHAAYLPRTRTPMTKRWDAADPAWVAGELWDRMIEQKGLRVETIVRPDPEGDRYDFQSITDAQMLDQTFNELVDLGLVWSVVSGVPIIGPLDRTPLVTLSEADFIGDDSLTLVRDGSTIVNDVLVRGKDNFARAGVDYFGQRLQAIKNVDKMSGVSNVTRAAEAYVKQTGVVWTRLELAPGTVLHPDAPISIDELMPSTRFVLEAEGVRQLMELTSVEVDLQAGIANTKVTMESALTYDQKQDMELDHIKKTPNVTLGGGAGSR